MVLKNTFKRAFIVSIQHHYASAGAAAAFFPLPAFFALGAFSFLDFGDFLAAFTALALGALGVAAFLPGMMLVFAEMKGDDPTANIKLNAKPQQASLQHVPNRPIKPIHCVGWQKLKKYNLRDESRHLMQRSDDFYDY